MSHQDVPLLPAAAMARVLGVSIDWLFDQARTGSLPAVPAGRTYLFHAPTVERLLLERATSTATEEVHRAVP